MIDPTTLKSNGEKLIVNKLNDFYRPMRVTEIATSLGSCRIHCGRLLKNLIKRGIVAEIEEFGTTLYCLAHQVVSGRYQVVASSNHNVASSNHQVAPSNYDVASSNHQVAPSNHDVASSNHQVAPSNHDVASSNHQVAPVSSPFCEKSVQENINSNITGLLQICIWHCKYRHQTHIKLTKKVYRYRKIHARHVWGL